METRTTVVEKIWKGDGNKKPTKIVGENADYITWDMKLLGLDKIWLGDQLTLEVEPQQAYKDRPQFLITRIASAVPPAAGSAQPPIHSTHPEPAQTSSAPNSEFSLAKLLEISDTIIKHLATDPYKGYSEGAKVDMFKSLVMAYQKTFAVVTIGKQKEKSNWKR